MIKKIIIVLAYFTLTLSADQVDKMLETNKNANRSSQVSQKKINNYSQQYENIYDEYLSISKELKEQTAYNKQLSLITNKQAQEIPQLQKQIKDIEVTNVKIVPLMFEMVDKLGKFVSIDTPFLQHERKDRVKKLKDYLSNPNMSTAGQFSTILESYKIEYSYARTLEVYRSQLNQNGTNKTVDFLRVGRLALYYRTLDASECGYYDLHSKIWLTLDKKYNALISKAIKIARKKVTPDFLTLPVLVQKDEK